MAEEHYILHYVNSNAFKNSNQILGTFEDSVKGAYDFNDSRYVSAKSDMDHAADHEAESDPHFTVNSNDSRYVSIDSVKSIILQKTDDTFAVLSLNIQSIAAKFDSFLGFISYSDENNIHFNAICLQETWLSHKSDASLYNISGYQLIHKGKSCSEHGGLITYLDEEYSYTVRDLMIASDLWEGLFTNKQHEHLPQNLTLGNIYRPPNKNDNNDVIHQFNSKSRPIIDQLGKEIKTCIITGDMNLLKTNERIKFQEYFDIFVSNGLFPKITYPTRFSKSGKRCTGSLIDHLFCKYLDGENC